MEIAPAIGVYSGENVCQAIASDSQVANRTEISQMPTSSAVAPVSVYCRLHLVF